MRLHLTKTLAFVAALTVLGCGGTPTVVDPDASIDARMDTINPPPDARIDTINPPDARIDSSSDAAVDAAGDVSPDAPQDFCAANPCMNGGTCANGASSYTCTCADGYEGTNCETNIDDCAPNPCMNGGTCEDGIDRYTCDCPAGFGGLECQDVLVSCTPNPCDNGGTCAVNGGVVECTCAAGYSGNTCEVNIDDCDPNPCVNGMCADGVADYTCACSGGWSGTNCDMDINECDANPCANGGACLNSDGSYMCMCAAGWTGANCDADINECDSAPCLNGGGCVNNDGSYMCMCPAGYDGMNCENNINECAGAPCQNGGTCMDGVGSYSCMCAAGYDGMNCENNINECAGAPCQNGGTCMDGVNSYSCSCAAGYNGMNCENNINECSPNPCQNGGSCTDGVNAFTCACTANFTGPTCSTPYVPTDCFDILSRGIATTNGLYTIDPDGSGSVPSFQVYCDLRGGGWTQILDQNTAFAGGGYLPAATWRAGVTNSAPNAGQWSVLQHMAAFAGQGGNYEFRYTANTAEDRFVEWQQTANPFTGRGTASNIRSFIPNQAGCGVFAGIANDGQAESALDGDAGGCWWFAIGSSGAYSGGIPAFNTPTSVVTSRARLYFRRLPATGSQICATVAEGGSLGLTCPPGTLMRAALFSSYGTATGTCGASNLSYSTCHSLTSYSQVSAACLGQNSCSVPATNTTFGDPCGGTFKALAARMFCQ